MEMQQSQSQTNRSKASQNSVSGEQPFSGYLENSKKSQQESQSNASSQQSKDNRQDESQSRNVAVSGSDDQKSSDANKSSGQFSEAKVSAQSSGNSETERQSEKTSSAVPEKDDDARASTEDSASGKKTDEESAEEKNAVKDPDDTDVVLADGAEQKKSDSLHDIIRLLMQGDEEPDAKNIALNDDSSLDGEKILAEHAAEKKLENDKPIILHDNVLRKFSIDEIAAKLAERKPATDTANLLNSIAYGNEDDAAAAELMPDMVKRLLDPKDPVLNTEGRLNKIQALASALDTNIKQGTLTEAKLENVSTLLGLEEGELTVDMDDEALFAKLIDRLDLDKMNGENILQNRMAVDKGIIKSEFLEQITVKTGAESLEKTSLMSSLNAANRPGAPLTNNPTVPQQMTLQTQVSNAEWGADFSKRIQFMVKSSMQHAELRLDPPDLGKIHVKINLSQDQANISFASGHSNVREAIENAIPRLRELLNESGFQLGDTDVASQFQQQSESHADNDGGGSGSAQSMDYDDDNDQVMLPNTAMSYEIDGVIDYFA